MLCLLCNSRLDVDIGLILGQRRRRWTNFKPVSKEFLGSSGRGDDLIISQEKVTCGMTQSSCIEPSHNKVANIMVGL